VIAAHNEYHSLYEGELLSIALLSQRGYCSAMISAGTALGVDKHKMNDIQYADWVRRCAT
jgi:hypothetical protein